MYVKLMTLLAKIRFEWLVRLFKKPTYLTPSDRIEIMDRLRKNNYIIATFDPYSLSGLFVRFSHWFLTGHKANYTHVLLNLEDSGEDFKFVEATSGGVHTSTFYDVFKHAQHVALLRPKYYTQDLFDDCVQEAVRLVGKDYDFNYKLDDESKMSCVEVVLHVIKQLPFYNDQLRCLLFLMKYERQLTPDMYVEVPDMEVVWEVKR